jgi:hypothetical protein
LGQGRGPELPYQSTNFALTQCRNNSNDVIYGLPGHAESIAGAGGINMNVPGVRLYGIDDGSRNFPTFNYITANTASFDVNSANVKIKNIYFAPLGFAGVLSAINVKAADCQITDCEIEQANGANQAVAAITTNANANRFKCFRNYIHGTNNAGSTAAITLVGGTDIRIEDNEMIGAYTAGVGAIQVITTAAVNLQVGRNVIQNLTTSNTKAFVDTITGTTGTFWANMIQILSGTAPVTAATMAVIANYYKAALGAAAPSTLL